MKQPYYLPPSLRVGPYIFKMTFRDILTDAEGHELLGCADYDHEILELAVKPSSGRITQRRMEMVLMHEVVHAILEAAGSPLRSDEALVEVVSQGVYAFLKANGWWWPQGVKPKRAKRQPVVVGDVPTPLP